MDRRSQLAVRAKKQLHDLRLKSLFERYQVYVATLPDDEGPLPPCDMLALIRPVKDLMEREDDGAPIPAADMDKAIPEATQRYSAEARRKLLGSLRETRRVLHGPTFFGSMVYDGGYLEVSGTFAELHWATSYYQCAFCEGYTSPLTYPGLLQHIRERHLRSSSPSWRLYAWWPTVQVTTPKYPSAHASGMESATNALNSVNLEESASHEEADQQVARLCKQNGSTAVPATFAQFIAENFHVSEWASFL